jgi:hypothetical protein
MSLEDIFLQLTTEEESDEPPEIPSEPWSENPPETEATDNYSEATEERIDG